MVRRRYQPGQIIYAQNDVGLELYKVVDGRVRISLIRSNGRHIVYCYFGPGDFFGESSLIDGGLRPQTAEAKTSVDVDVLSAAALRRLRTSFRDVEDGLLRVMTSKMRLLSEQVAHATLDSITSRVAAKIIENAKGFGQIGAERQQAMSLSQSDLASMLGMSRQSVSKVLQRLQLRGAIGIEYGRIHIVDLSRLDDASAHTSD
jgi:CRP/FNR family cyclic AMP-dependent transcriptional regulator